MLKKNDSKNTTKKIVKEINFELKIQFKYDSNFTLIQFFSPKLLSKKSKLKLLLK
jgi:hypothetical protein